MKKVDASGRHEEKKKDLENRILQTYFILAEPEKLVIFTTIA